MTTNLKPNKDEPRIGISIVISKKWHDRLKKIEKKGYLKLFKDCNPDTITGEATTWYLFSKDAAKNIYEFNNEAKIIIMLRNPVDMLYSLHSHYMYHGNIETIKDFKKALDAEEDRKKGINMPKNSTRPYGVFYSDIIDYAPQIERYFKTFGRENVKVIIFEEFIRDTSKIYYEVLEFLSIEEKLEPHITRVNANKKVRN